MQRSLLFTLLLFAVFASAQKMKEYTFGQPFVISYPEEYWKVYDLNEVASAQFSDEAHGKYSVIIQTEKENLSFEKVAYTDILDASTAYSQNLVAGLKQDAALQQTAPKKITIGNYKAAESTVQGNFTVEEGGEVAKLFYYLTVVETPGHYYQLVFWCNLADKAKNEEEFRKIAKSFKEGK